VSAFLSFRRVVFSIFLPLLSHASILFPSYPPLSLSLTPSLTPTDDPSLPLLVKFRNLQRPRRRHLLPLLNPPQHLNNHRRVRSSRLLRCQNLLFPPETSTRIPRGCECFRAAGGATCRRGRTGLRGREREFIEGNVWVGDSRCVYGRGGTGGVVYCCELRAKEGEVGMRGKGR